MQFEVKTKRLTPKTPVAELGPRSQMQPLEWQLNGCGSETPSISGLPDTEQTQERDKRTPQKPLRNWGSNKN